MKATIPPSTAALIELSPFNGLAFAKHRPRPAQPRCDQSERTDAFYPQSLRDEPP